MKVALVDRDIKKLIADKKISSAFGFDLDGHTQPASIDLPVGDFAYVLKQKFLPFNNDVDYILERFTIEKVDLRESGILYKGITYLIPTIDVNLPDGTYAKMSPKSSIGRVDLLVRSIFDRVGLYDSVPPGSKGRVWIEVTPQSFNIRLKKGMPLNQMMLFENIGANSSDHREVLNSACLGDDCFVYDENGYPLDANFYEKKLLMTLNAKKGSFVGYSGRHTNEVIDLSKKDEYDPNKFFKSIVTGNNDHGKLTLEKDRFYILSTKERISVPLDYSSEMIPFFNQVGELRVHYAGFFDPGFGYGKEGEVKGCVAVLEVRPHENITIYDGQPICLMEFFKNKSMPDNPYGFSNNNYSSQTKVRLAKYFRQ
ncbi:MAG: 2'-deoxycytidine 5'-triphosphate deaminase domain-containing protein [Candidatus Woesearchaeota archaeon]